MKVLSEFQKSIVKQIHSNNDDTIIIGNYFHQISNNIRIVGDENNSNIVLINIPPENVVTLYHQYRSRIIELITILEFLEKHEYIVFVSNPITNNSTTTKNTTYNIGSKSIISSDTTISMDINNSRVSKFISDNYFREISKSLSLNIYVKHKFQTYDEIKFKIASRNSWIAIIVSFSALCVNIFLGGYNAFFKSNKSEQLDTIISEMEVMSVMIDSIQQKTTTPDQEQLKNGNKDVSPMDSLISVFIETNKELNNRLESLKKY